MNYRTKGKSLLNCTYPIIARASSLQSETILSAPVSVSLKHDLQDRIEDLIAFLDEQTEAIIEYSEPLARRLIEKVTVYDEKLVVEFKSGMTVEVEA